MDYYSFTNDYSEGAHPHILNALIEGNLEQCQGYGLDPHCARAVSLIRSQCGREDLDVHFLTGGTQTNRTVISSVLRPYQAVIAASTGHINVHETGAVEASGHKVLTADSPDGKLTLQAVEQILDAHTDEHMVQPKMVYISDSTELGTVYQKAELEGLSHLCRQKGLFLFLDGARLGAALMSRENDVTMADLAELTDLFYIGGTKNGALFGEALVIKNQDLKADFRYQLKQNGAMLAKGWLLGVQFETLFEDGLFYELATHADAMAARLKEGLEAAGFSFLAPPVSNQLFPIVSEELAGKLAKHYGFNVERRLGHGRQAIRLVTSWATKPEAVEQFLTDLSQMDRQRKE